MTKEFDFSWKFKDFAIRTMHRDWKDKTSPLDRNHPIELIKYLNDKHSSCYVVAMWGRDEEGYELHFVGSRPFEDISPDEIATIWRQLQAAQKMLDEYFEAEEDYD